MTDDEVFPNLDNTTVQEFLDILTYIPHPIIKPLHIHGWDTAKALENVDPAQRTIWTNFPGAKALCYRAYGGKFEDRDEIIELRELIKSDLGLTTNPTVATPIPEVESLRRDTGPHCTLVRDISPEKIQELIEKVRHNGLPTPHHLTAQ